MQISFIPTPDKSTNMAHNGIHFMSSSFMPQQICWKNYSLYLGDIDITRDFKSEDKMGIPYIEDIDKVSPILDYLTKSINYLKVSDIDRYIANLNDALKTYYTDGMDSNQILAIISQVIIPAKYNIRTNP